MDAKTFSVLDALNGTNYPTAEVTVYTAWQAAYEFRQWNAMADAAQDGEVVNEIEQRLAELREVIEASALTYHMRGFPPKIHRKINALTRAKFKIDANTPINMDSEAFEHMNMLCIAESVTKVVNAQGEEESRRFTPEDVQAWMDNLHPDEFLKISDKVYELSYQSLAYDAAVTPDFS